MPQRAPEEDRKADFELAARNITKVSTDTLKNKKRYRFQTFIWMVLCGTRRLSGSECERSFTGAELLRGNHGAHNEIKIRCVYNLEGGVKPLLESAPSTVTVLDLRKPNISVSTEHTETHVHCEAPPGITGADFYLYSNRIETHTKSSQAGREERAVIFTVPHSSDSTLKYCCSYQFKALNSKLSDCVGAKNKDQSGTTKEPSKLPKAELELHPAVISVEESVNLKCRRHDSSPESHCNFIINQRRLSGSGCERSVTGAELLSGNYGAHNEIRIRCVYSLEGGVKPLLQSAPSTVTVLDLRKPNISVSTEHTETHIHCKAPPGITGANFYLYSNTSETHTKSSQAGKEERAVIFTVPRSSDSTLKYCCSYQFKALDSKLSDCVGVKNTDQSGTTKDQNWLKTPLGTGVVLIVVGVFLGMTGACLYWVHKKWKSNRLPTPPINDVSSKGAEASNATSPPEVTYSTVTHLASQTSAFQSQQDNVVYSSLKTD
ncbi:hypothetical protein SKAU_G00226050 [Synaphobranchus kaupii]|uniref:C19orf38 Ig domain-containing protein n=1 Tax=Synaphobranchus kaupii TaxID=118154 RepID=A0A9Q1IWI8_SYNKA|nr:hypothetical protein SKAU_G00226050 [Synaphobranchus kaupii]